MASNKELIKKILTAIKDAAKERDCSPRKITLSQVLLQDEDLVEWDIRKLGGLDSIKKSNFPEEGKSLSDIYRSKETSAYVSKLESLLGQKQNFQEEILSSINRVLRPLPVIKLKEVKKQTTKIEREIVMVLNDTHYGMIVQKDEVNDLNSYGWEEASRRTAMVLAETIDFKPHTRKEVKKVHLVLNGDILTGLIHGLNTKGHDLFVHQLNGALYILTHVVSYLLQHFKEVEVHGITGNHEDSLHKREHGKRVNSEKFDSLSNVVYYSLSSIFKNNDRATFSFPKTPYLFFQLPGGRAMAAHGDTIFGRALGNPGTAINVKSLSEEIRKFNSGEVAKGRDPVKLVLFGHVHTFAHFITSDGIQVYIAPSLSGTDGFAHSLNINNNFTGQVVFESTKDFILGDSRLIRTHKADNNKELDKLIPVFKQDLKWKK